MTKIAYVVLGGDYSNSVQELLGIFSDYGKAEKCENRNRHYFDWTLLEVYNLTTGEPQ